MNRFTSITAIAVPIDEPNVDTNQLCPTRFNKVPRGPAYARILFHDRRFNADGSEKEHILNAEPFNRAQIIVADRNWGSGSSRESAVYALYEFGIRCVIAISFGDIFWENSVKGGLLLVRLDEGDVAALRSQLHVRPGAEVTVDLERQTVTAPDGRSMGFEIEPGRKRRLLNGLDEIGVTLRHEAAVAAFEQGYRARRPWLFRHAAARPG